MAEFELVPEAIAWPCPPAQWPLGLMDAHAWAASLDGAPESMARYASTLAPEERERAARFHFDRHRNRFIAGRGLLRAILGSYLDTDPAQLEFIYGPQGKPALAAPFAHSGLQFNLAHSENLALLAVTKQAPIGADVERIRTLRDADQLVARFFSARENTIFRALPEQQKSVAFFNLWTRKEAWLKATGEGIAHLLKLVEVSFLPGEPARLLRVDSNSPNATRWHLHDLVPAPGFAAAVATAASTNGLKCWRWPDYSALGS